MSQPALIAIGATIGGPVGGAVGAILGGYIDQQFIYPRLFGTDSPEPQDLSGMEFTGASEGDPLNICFGRHIKVPGVIVWAGPKTVVSGTSGGKGGPSSNTQSVYQDVAIKFAKGVKVDKLLKVYANQILLFDNEAVFSITGNHRYEFKRIAVTGGPVYMQLIHISELAPSLWDKFPVGSEIVIAGAAPSNNNGTFVVTGQSWRFINAIADKVSTITGDAGTDTVTVTMSIPHGRTIGTQHKVRVWKATGTPSIIGIHDATFTTSTVFTFPFTDPASSYSSPFSISSYTYQQDYITYVNASGSDGLLGTSSSPGSITRTAQKIRIDLLESLLWHDGDETIDETIDDIESQRSPQVSDPIIEAREGVDGTYPMLGHAYATVEALLLDDFGHVTPNFTIEFAVDEDETTTSAISKILAEAGLDPSQYDLSGATPKPLYQHVWRGVQQPAAILGPLMILGDYVAREDYGKLFIFDRSPVFKRTSRKYERSNNSAISYTSTTLTDTRATWIPGEWVGAIVSADFEEMIITSNTKTVLTGGGWSPTPDAGVAYGIFSVSTTTTSLSDSEQDWATDRWIGAVVTAGGKTMTITSNTSDTVFGSGWSGGGQPAGLFGIPYSIDSKKDLPIDSADLAAHESGGDLPQRLKIQQRGTLKTPTQCHVTYTDVDNNHDQGVAIERDESAAQDEVMRVNLPLGMTRDQAQEVATRLLWGEIGAAETVSFTLPPSYLYLGTNDRVKITENGELRTIRITKIATGENSIMECEGIVEHDIDFTVSTAINATPE